MVLCYCQAAQHAGRREARRIHWLERSFGRTAARLVVARRPEMCRLVAAGGIDHNLELIGGNEIPVSKSVPGCATAITVRPPGRAEVRFQVPCCRDELKKLGL